MKREHHKWYSPRLHRDMEMLVFGHSGTRVLVFPTSMGRYYEYEDRGMVGALGDHLEAGRVQLYCVDSMDAETFYNWNAHPGWRIWRHMQYEEYILNEVLPLSRQMNPNPEMVAHGCSFGAYHAMNIALRHPQWFGRVLALSGKYDMSNFFGGYSDTNIYLNTPSQFVANLPEGPQLDAIRRMQVIIAVGRDDPNIAHNRAFNDQLWRKGVWTAFREWDGWSHDWPYWMQMVRAYVFGAD